MKELVSYLRVSGLLELEQSCHVTGTSGFKFSRVN